MKYPLLAKVGGTVLRFLYDAATHPAFAVVLALLLVGFVISGAVTIVVSVSVYGAWLIAVLWLAHSETVKRINILPRFILVFGFAALAAFAANRYVNWCLLNYTANQPKVVQSDSRTNNDQLLGRMRELFKKEIHSDSNPPVSAPSLRARTSAKDDPVDLPALKMTNNELRGEVIAVTEPLRAKAMSYYGSYRQLEGEAMSGHSTYDREADLLNRFAGDDENKVLCARANYLRDLVSVRLGIKVENGKRFEVDDPVGLLHQCENLNDLVMKLPLA